MFHSTLALSNVLFCIFRLFHFVFFGSFILYFSAILFCLFRVLCFLPVLLSPVPRQHTLHIRSAHGIRGMDLHGVKGLPLHQPFQQFDGIAALLCKISQVMVEIQYFDLDAVSLRLPDQCPGFIHRSGALISPGCRAEII